MPFRRSNASQDAGRGNGLAGDAGCRELFTDKGGRFVLLKRELGIAMQMTTKIDGVHESGNLEC